MKKYICLVLFSVLLGIVFSFVACFRDEASDRAGATETSVASTPALSSAEARAFFEANLPAGRTRAEAGSLEESDGSNGEGNSNGTDPSDPLHAGEMAPAWDAVSHFYNTTHVAVGAPFDAEYEYQTLHVIDDKYARVLPMPRRLVVIKDPATERMGAYMRFYMPEIAYADLYPESHYADMLIPGDENDFSGLVIYATLAGTPVSAARFADGVLQTSASMMDSLYTADENFARLSALLEGVYAVRRRVEEPKTRASDEEEVKDVNGGGIEEVVVVGEKPKPPFDWSTIDGSDIELPLFFAHWTIADTGGGGPAPPSQNDDSKGYKRNPKVRIDKKIDPILDSLVRECMGEKLVGNIQTPVNIGFNFGQTDSTIDGIPNPNDPSQMIGYEITLGRVPMDYTLFEELMHAYQGVYTPEYMSQAMNNEIEAKLAWYMYLQADGGREVVGSGSLGQGGFDYFERLSDFVRSGDFESPEFFDAYEGAVSSLRTIEGYDDEDYYTFDPGEMDFDKLMELIEGCLTEQ